MHRNAHPISTPSHLAQYAHTGGHVHDSTHLASGAAELLRGRHVRIRNPPSGARATSVVHRSAHPISTPSHLAQYAHTGGHVHDSTHLASVAAET